MKGKIWIREIGCLFEDDLCRPFEICVNDGVFGRCQQGPVIDIYRYEVSPAILEHLRTVLQKLSHRGTVWVKWKTWFMNLG
ncbi:receptor-type tyrosine-protein phosphatase N2-like [Macrotis lagotis]|uniref:receptor-type tyrosine-protein phosphatase N2-like n=1 Tax=Macrotis lagotis TaxID=92651 RepID=UPI003D68511F